ncbi:MAG: hypothetical protein M0Z59_03080 [Nitrospiraceae bacterium]|nr:hypothetical protein [Nitrospiraceae bacterium]
MTPEFIKTFVNAGVGAAMAFVILVGLYRIAGRLGLEFVKAQKEQAQALGRQAQSMEGLRDAIELFIKRDYSEHREMLVMLRYIAQNRMGPERIRQEQPEKTEFFAKGEMDEVNRR